MIVHKLFHNDDVALTFQETLTPSDDMFTMLESALASCPK
jgi:hypothetical protein